MVFGRDGSMSIDLVQPMPDSVLAEGLKFK